MDLHLSVSVDTTDYNPDPNLRRRLPHRDEAMDALQKSSPIVAEVVNRSRRGAHARSEPALSRKTRTIRWGIREDTPLVSWFVGSDYQVAEYQRYYADYQEGLPLGLESYTVKQPGQMYFKVATEDIGIVEEWGEPDPFRRRST